MSVIASQVPKRNPSGYTPQPPYGPWADCGAGDDFFYQTDADDFNGFVAGNWTATENNGGTVALTAGGGGQLLFTTGATATNYASIQRPAANIVVPQGASAGKKLFWAARLQLASLNSGFIAGLCDATTTPFAAITDGIWFSKAAGAIGSNGLMFNVSSGSTNLATALSFLPVAATEFDMAFYVDRNGNVNYSIGAQLFGWIPQSGTGASVTPPNPVPALPILCPTGRLYSGNPASSGYTASGYTLPTANLTHTAGVVTSAAAAQTMTLNFLGAKRER